ncbi:MAG: hypothetical protein HYY55_02835 [Candidatus Niyogibacteria bacterium]|nr:MAG: hypothetical protein HYY55_02835 [Candidatus Niyogibacteria bacterium]
MFAFGELSEAQKHGSPSPFGINQKGWAILRRERRPALLAGAKNGRSEKAISPSRKHIAVAKNEFCVTLLIFYRNMVKVINGEGYNNF